MAMRSHRARDDDDQKQRCDDTRYGVQNDHGDRGAGRGPKRVGGCAIVVRAGIAVAAIRLAGSALHNIS